MRELWGRLTRVDHPDPEVRRRGAAAQTVILGILLVGFVATGAMLTVPDGNAVPLTVTVAVWVLSLGSFVLVRAGHVSAGAWLLLGLIAAGNVTVVVTTGDFGLAPVYFALVASIGVALLPTRVSVWVVLGAIVAAVLLAVLPGVSSATVVAREVAVAAVIVILTTSVAALLGVRGQQRARAEAEVLADRLAQSNRDLEARVAERTRDLAFALDRQEQLAAELAEQTIRDPLTDVYNRRFADEELVRLAARAARSGRPLAVAMVDLDRFKAINDTLGHAAGDVVLRHVAESIVDETRRGDAVVRWGGEEFVLLLPDTDLAAAVEVAERVRVRIERRGVDLRTEGSNDRGGTVRLTVSAGVAVWPAAEDPPGSGPDAEALLAAADARLYEAKQAGRNRVVPASDDLDLTELSEGPDATRR